METIGKTDLAVSRLCLGGNVFGWTADEAASFEVLDAFVANGGNFIDTADIYSVWVSGNKGGESETIIGNWLASRGGRDRVVIASKVGMGPRGIEPQAIRDGVTASLQRMQTDYIDLYYMHKDHTDRSFDETLRVLDDLVDRGLIRHVAYSNVSADRLAQAVDVAKAEDLAPIVAVQPHYNLLHRDEYEGALQDLCVQEGMACFPYYALASGFLTGKYRTGDGVVDDARAKEVAPYDSETGARALEVLEGIAADHGASMGATALAWLVAQPGVVAPIASARSTDQLEQLLPVLDLELTADEVEALNALID